jgi:hypothetical protein
MSYILFQAVPLENGAELLFETEFPMMLFLILDVINESVLDELTLNAP